MNVFLSWSGDVSKEVAEALREWLPYVINNVKPWMSAEDIDKGARWSSDLADQLTETKAGVLCLTSENLDASWLLFEAGALSKSLGRTFVCPYLFGIEEKQLRGPLVQFQAARADREDTARLLHTLRRALKIKNISEKQLDKAFEVWWPVLEERLKSIRPSKLKKPEQRSDRDVLDEVLELSRTQVRQHVGASTNLRSEDQPIRWSSLLATIQNGPQLFKHYVHQNLQALKARKQAELTESIRLLESQAKNIDSEWHQLVSQIAALHRRFDLLSTRDLGALQAVLMYMAERGVHDDLQILRYLKKRQRPSVKEIERLLGAAETEIIKRSPAPST